MSDAVLRIALPEARATEALGARLARACGPPGVIFLRGELGAGKTTLTRAFIQALGHGGSVPSPTYTLVESYHLGACSCHHLDLYRLSDPEELEYLGLRELLTADALLLVEWPERGAAAVLRPDLQIRLDYAGSGRSAVLEAGSERGRAWLGALS